MSLKKTIKGLLKGQLLKATGTYGLATLLNAALPFLLLPVLSYYLSPEEYGLVAMFLLVQNILGPLVSLNSASAVSKRYFYDEDKTIFQKYVGNSVMLLAIALAILAVIITLLSSFLSSVTNLNLFWLLMTLISAACFGLVQLRLVVWQVKNKTKNYALLQVGLVALKLILSLLFVVLLLYGWQGRTYGIVLSHIVIGGFCFWSLKYQERVILQWDKKLMLHAIQYGGPTIPHSLAGFAIAYTDRLTISNLIGLDSMGLYTVAYQVGSVFNMATNAFNMAFIPWLYDKLKQSASNAAAKLHVVRVTYIASGILVVAWLVLSTALPLVFTLFSADYSESSVFLSFLLLGFMFNGMYYLFCNYIFYSEKTAVISYITIGSALLNVPLTYYFVDTFGALGAAQATAIVNALTFILTSVVANRIIPMPWLDFKGIFKGSRQHV